MIPTPDPPDVRNVDREHALHLLEQMLRVRRFEERCVEEYSKGRIRGFMHLYIGEEAVATGVMESVLTDDRVVATYREHAHALLRGISAEAIMAEMFGVEEGCSRGRGGSMHLFSAEHRFYGGYAIVGGGLPIAVGLALADKMAGRDHVTVAFFGEGAAAEGEFHESMNLASIWQLPVLFLCENNLYAMGTHIERSEAEIDLTVHARSYKVDAAPVDGMDVGAVEAAAREALEQVRTTGAPYFLEARTYRFRAHSMFDPERYRDKAEVEGWKDKGPIVTWMRRLRDAAMLTDDDVAAIEERVSAEVERAVAFAEAGHLEPVEDLMRDVYAGEVPS
ncbi:MAG: pyruvate dehydrogenase (acetyl-transferring) E1 component subunit alpha [Myxococcota bacterium]